MPSVAQQVVEELRAAGVDRLFGYPGGEVLALMEAARQAGLPFVLAHHEAAAGNMAAAYGRARGVPGVVLATLGPGAANLLLPLANAWLDREPLVAISAQLPPEWPAAHTHQRLALDEIFRPTTKYCATLRRDGVRATVRAALHAARSAPLGPSYLALPASTATAEATDEEADGAPDRAVVAPGHWTAPETAAEAIRARVLAARRPLVVLGLGCDAAQAPAVRRWVEGWRLPTLVTPKAKGLLDERSPCFVGVCGGMAVDALAREVLQQADLIIGFGFDPVEIDQLWHTELPILPILESPNAGGLLPAQALLVGHGAVLAALLAAPAPAPAWTQEEVAALRRPFIAASPGRDVPRETGVLWPGDIVRAIRAAAPEQTVLTTDVGAHKYLFGQFWPTYEPGGFWTSNGLSGMGYGIPAALGVKLAWPQRPVIAVVGDGGFAMNAAELETAARVGAPLVVVVLVDGALGLIRVGQVRRGYAVEGTEFTPVDAAAVARAWGVTGIQVATPAELAAAVEGAVQREQPTVIAVPTRVAYWEQFVT